MEVWTKSITLLYCFDMIRSPARFSFVRLLASVSGGFLCFSLFLYSDWSFVGLAVVGLVSAQRLSVLVVY